MAEGSTDRITQPRMPASRLSSTVSPTSGAATTPAPRPS